MSRKVKILICKDCNKHDYQDRKYGFKKRVHNLCPKKGGQGSNMYRCTVCGNVRQG